MDIIVNLLLTSLVVTASVLGAAMALPQTRRLIRTRRVDGLSPVWIGVSLAINGWWLAYGFFAGVWVLIPVSLVSLGLYATMAGVYLHVLGWRGAAGLALGGFGLGMSPLPALVVGGWELAGVAVGLGYGIQLLPAVVASWRTRDLSGIAPETWLLSTAESSVWLIYGLAVGDAALMVAGTVGAAMSVAILVRLASTGYRPLHTIGASWAPRVVR